MAQHVSTFETWLKHTYQPAVARSGERLPAFETASELPLQPVYSQDPGSQDPGELPGVYPYTRGIHPSMYRSRLWTMRQYAGFGDAAESNKRYRYLLGAGQTGLSVAFDLPTQMGYDSDSPRAAGEVGKVGVAIDSLADMQTLLQDIPLATVSTSMTINATAATLLCLYMAVAQRQNVAASALRGTIQNDILKEYMARGTYIYPPRPSMRLITDTFAFCQKEMPQWNTISISGYHIREAGCTAMQEIAFTLADGLAYIDAALASGLHIDSIGPRLAFFFNVHNDFFEEVAKFRAARRLWAKLVQTRYRAKDARSLMLRFHAQTAGSTLTAQQPNNNVVRVALQALSAVLGGTQSLHTNSLDEAMALPSQTAAQLALRTQQIIAHETGVGSVVDPLGGSYFVENLTTRLESGALELISHIDSLGGMVAAIEQGFPQRAIEEAAYKTYVATQNGSQKIVGVNIHQEEESAPPNLLRMASAQERQLQRLAEVRASRSNTAVSAAQAALKTAAQGDDNLLPHILRAVQAMCTVGEIADTLRTVFGEHREIRT